MRIDNTLILLFLCGIAYGQSGSVTVQPDCSVAGPKITATTLTSATLNALTGCPQAVSWTLSYSSTGFSAISLVVESAPDNAGTPGSFVTYAGTVVTGVNPNTATTSATTTFTGYYPYLRVRLASHTGTGSITYTLYGYRNSAKSGSGGGGSGTVTTSGSPAAGNLTKFSAPTVITNADLSGDATTSGGTAVSVVKVNGGAIPALATALASNGSNQIIAATVQGNGAKVQLSTGSTTTSDCVQFDANGNTVDAGAPCGTGGGSGTPGSSFFSSTTQAGPSNSASEVSLIGTVTGSKTIAANTFQNGQVLEMWVSGFFSLPAVADSLTLKFKCGSTVLGSASFTPAAGVETNGSFVTWLRITAIGTGASGAFMTNGLAQLSGTGLTSTVAKILNTSNVSFDFTTSCAADITAQWGGAQVGESITGTNAGAWIPGTPSGAMVKLAETILGGTASTVTFSSIPATYRHLELTVTGRGDSGVGTEQDVLLQFNGDTGANYNDALMFGSPAGGSAGASGENNVTMMRVGSVADAGAPSNAVGAVRCTIYDYARTSWQKNATCMNFRFQGASSTGGFIISFGGNWASTAAITSITVIVAAGNFIANSVFSLYGIQ